MADNIRTISVRLGADVKNFVAGMQSAKRNISGVSTEMRAQFAKVNAHTDMLVEKLKLTGTQSQIAGIKMTGLSQKISMQSEYIKRLNTELTIAKFKFGATSKEVQKLELDMLRAIKVEAQMKNELAGMKTPRFQMGTTMKTAVAASTAAAGLGIIASLKKMSATGLEFNNVMQQNQASFATLLGDMTQAKALMGSIITMAEKTPFETADLTQGAKLLLAYGVNAQNIMPALRMLGDVSLGNKEKFDSLALAFGQVQANGRLMGQEVLQMVNAGFNPLQVISEKTGKSMATLRKEMEDGKISSAMVADAFKIATSEGGRFFGAMDAQSKTFAGQLSTIKDNANIALGQAFKPLFEYLSTTVFPKLIADLKNSESGINKFFRNLAEITQFTVDYVIPSFVGFVNVCGFVAKGGKFIGEAFKWGFNMVIDTAKGALNLIIAIGNAITKVIEKASFGKLKMGRTDYFDYSFSKEGTKAGKGGLGVLGKVSSQIKANKEKVASAGFDLGKEFNNSLVSGLSDMPDKLDDTADKIKDSTDKASDALKNFVDKVKSKAEQYRDSLSLFEKATMEKISGERLLVRLQSQLKVLDSWKNSMLALKSKLGEQSGLLAYLQQQGPQSAGQAQALANLDPTRLREYEMLFNRKSNIATDMAAQAVATETVREKKLEQVVININGGVVTQNVNDLVQLITRQLQINGVM